VQLVAHSPRSADKYQRLEKAGIIHHSPYHSGLSGLAACSDV